MRPAHLLVLLLSALLFVACGGGKEEVKAPEKEVPLDDAFALLPANAIAIGTVDARSFFGSQTFGADLAKAVEKMMPIGEEAGFVASRDTDRVTWASYSYQGIDVAAIVVGRFDEAKIKQVATSGTPTKAGVPLVVSPYAGRDVYTVSNVGFTLLSNERAVVGTESGIRRVLDRIRDKRVSRDLPAWMIATLETPGAAAAVAADFASQPVPEELLRQIPVTFLQNVKAARIVAQFKEHGVHVAGSVTYPDGQSAEQASNGFKQAAGYTKALALLGVKIDNVDVKVEQQDVQVQLDVDDQSLRQLLASSGQWLGR